MIHWLLPTIAHAQSGSASGAKAVIFRISEYVLNPLIKVGFLVAAAYFMWGLVEYIYDRNNGFIFDKDGKKSGDGPSRIIWGLVGLFIMVSAFGIMKMIAGLVGSDIRIP